MNSFVQRMVGDDFVWSAITGSVLGRVRRSNTSFININCPMCMENGEPTPDRKMRCGIKNNTPGVGIYCLRCGFKTIWKPGDGLPFKFRSFMSAIGVADVEIKRLNLRALQYRRLVESADVTIEQASLSVSFARVPLPKGARSFDALAMDGCTDPDFLEVVEYLYSRGEDIASYKFFWTPDTENLMNRRVIIPFYRGDDLVGWTARCIDPVDDKYRTSVQTDYLFNNRVMHLRDRKYVIVVEGPLDALAIDGVATLGAKMTEKQIHWLKTCGKEIIVVPDRDNAGQRLINIAVNNGWKVAFPSLHKGHPSNWWEDDVKDVAEAVLRYGRLYTLCSILRTATDNKIKIGMQQKMMKR